MTLYQFAFLVKKHLIFICVCAIVCAVVGGAYAATKPASYSATTTFYCEADLADVGTDGTPIDPSSANIKLATALCRVLNDNATIAAALTQCGLDEDSQYLAEADNEGDDEATAIVAITASGPDEQMAINLANTLYQQAHTTGVDVLGARNITLISIPEAPLEQDSTSVASWALIGLIFGLFVGIIIVVVRDLIRPRLYAGAQAAALSELPLLGRIKRKKACDDDDDRLVLNIQFSAKDAPVKQLAVASTDKEEDAQLVAQHLVSALQRSDRDAHHVSADSDRASLEQEAPGEEAAPLEQEAPGEEAALPEAAGLDVVAIPSVAEVPKAVLSAKDASGVVLVVSPGNSLRADFEDCVDELRLAGAKLYGICSLE